MPVSDQERRIIRRAIILNEIGENSSLAYMLSYAKSANSGPSFGAFQHDLAASTFARAVLNDILTRYLGNPKRASEYVASLACRCTACPVSAADEVTINSALQSDIGRLLVDAADNKTFDILVAQAELCQQAAAQRALTLDIGALCGIACWANMTGAPTTVELWLEGSSVKAAGGTIDAPSGDPVQWPDFKQYLKIQKFEMDHPQSLAHIEASVVAAIPSNGST